MTDPHAPHFSVPRTR